MDIHGHPWIAMDIHGYPWIWPIFGWFLDDFWMVFG